MHSPCWISLRHLLVDDAATRGHPLHITRRDGSAVAQAVSVLNRSRQHVRNGFNSAMWMPWKSCKVVIGHVVPKVVEQQEWIKLRRVAEPKRPAQMHACAFERWFGFD